MKKEANNPTPTPKPTPKPTPAQTQTIKYSAKVGGKKESLTDLIKKVFPRSMRPTGKTGWVFGAIFILVVIIGLLRFPLGSMLAGNIDISIEVGLPWPFLVFDLENPESLPIRFGGLIGDLVLYLIISYAIDIAINAFMTTFQFKRGRKSIRPRAYTLPETKQKSIAEKAAEKVVSKKATPATNPKL